MIQYVEPLDLIKQNYNQEELWLNLVGIDVNNPINSLRSDTKAGSVQFFYSDGWLKMTDYADTRFKHYNIIDAVRHLHNVGFRQAVDIILENKTRKKPIIPTYKKVDIAVKTQDWTADRLQYWKSYGIDIETLKAYNVHDPKEVYINTGTGYYGIKLDKLSFIYHFPLSGHKKLYQPHSSSLKWLSSAKKSDIFGQITTDKVIITSSCKDCMTLRNHIPLEYSIIAPQSESTIIDLPDNIKAVLWYDNDVAGIRLAKQHSEIYGCNYYVQSDCKDPSDLYKFDTKIFSSNIENLIKLL